MTVQKQFEDDEDLCLLRGEKLSTIGEPTRSLDDILADDSIRNGE